MPRKIFTIGHSNLTFLKFLALIQANNIHHIIDIRSIPYSRQALWSNKSRLPEMLKPFGIRYTYLGHVLGGKRTTRPKAKENQREKTGSTYQDGINHILALIENANATLLCAESDPAKCHRQHIIAQTLLDSEVEVIHILRNGNLKPAWREEPTPAQPTLFQNQLK